MIENVLRHMGGIENYGILSLMLFFICFFGMIIWVLLMKKPFLKKMSQLPLEPDLQETVNRTQHHE
jgi:hypothetical protein